MLDIIVLGGGCFWCVEFVFLFVVGVKEVEFGYVGGNIKNFDYRFICFGKIGYVEVVKVFFDIEKILLS